MRFNDMLLFTPPANSATIEFFSDALENTEHGVPISGGKWLWRTHIAMPSKNYLR